jgi:hypothetical protein
VKKDVYVMWISLPIVILSLIASFFGVFYGDAVYAREVLSYKTQGIGQDLVTLCIVIPVFIISMWSAWQKKAVGLLFWGGCLFYFFYTYTIYSFGLHYNRFFLVYCVLLGLSTYGFIYFLLQYTPRMVMSDVHMHFIPIYLFIIAGVFYLLWLSEEIPSMITNTIPKSVSDANIMTNPVHIVDISFCLPLLILTGVLIRKHKVLGYLLVPVALLFSILLALAIICMLIVMSLNHVAIDYVLTVIFSLIAVFSIFLLVTTTKTLRKNIRLVEDDAVAK